MFLVHVDEVVPDALPLPKHHLSQVQAMTYTYILYVDVIYSCGNLFFCLVQFVFLKARAESPEARKTDQVSTIRCHQ